MSISQLPRVLIEHNVRLLSNHTLGGYPNTGEGMAMKITPDGRRILYLSNEHPPIDFSILDVTDPTAPEMVWQKPVPNSHTRGNSLALRGDILLTAHQTVLPGQEPAGFWVYDVSDPVKPRAITFFDCSGPHSQGVHYVSFMDGRYAHISTGYRDFEPHNPKDFQFYMIVDLDDPEHPREVGRWWLPGQRKGDSEPLLPRHPEPFDWGYRPHNTLVWPERPDRAYVAYIDGGVVILDIADKSQPKLISRWDYHPPFLGFTHTVVPLFDRGLMLVSDEAGEDDGRDWPMLVWVVDARVETNLVPIATLPLPEGFDEFHRIGGRIGAHNLHENETEPGAARLQNTVVSTWFSAGMRIYDIRDPFRPQEIAAFLPETPQGQRGSRISDIFVDDRNLIYVGDRARGGLYILEYTGDVPLD
jgi:hypothetical protein